MSWVVLFYSVFLSFAQADNNDTATVIVTELGALKVGEDFPSFNGQTSDGGRLSSRSIIGQGNVSIVSYAATWCQPCRYGLPIIERVVHADDTVQAVYVTLDKELTKVQRWAMDLQIKSPIVVDRFNAIAKRHGVISEDGKQSREIPITIVIDGKGIIRQILTTEGHDFDSRLIEAIDVAKQSSTQFEGPTLQSPDSSNHEKAGIQ